MRHAPLSAWLPSYDVTAGGATTSHTTPCQDVRHPVDYSGESMLTVYTVDLSAGLGDVAPVSLAADGATVYGTASSLYIASSPKYGKAREHTQLHRYDISRPGRPTYLGSGERPGRASRFLLAVRVSTASPGRHHPPHLVQAVPPPRCTSSNDDTLQRAGRVGGLGRGEQVHAVRFLGPLAFVVTYKSVDPLYVLDLTDPAHPTRAGELKATGYSDYLHPTSDGRLLGVGSTVNSHNSVSGMQLSLFDVTDPSSPSRIARIQRRHTETPVGNDPHGFLYWPATGTAVIPVRVLELAHVGRRARGARRRGRHAHRRHHPQPVGGRSCRRRRCPAQPGGRRLDLDDVAGRSGGQRSHHAAPAGLDPVPLSAALGEGQPVRTHAAAFGGSRPPGSSPDACTSSPGGSGTACVAGVEQDGQTSPRR